MFKSTSIELVDIEVGKKFCNQRQRLTAFWAFSEAGLGGLLHITRLPFKGIIIAGAATTFISLIAEFSKSKGSILRSTVIVTVVKFLVSPHTPITAAIAVFAQGLSGELFFFSKKFKKILIPPFSMFIQFITAIQKILIVTILFGQNFWVTVDDFANSVLNQLIPNSSIEFSLLIIISYIFIHIVFGLIIGVFILKLIRHLENADAETPPKLNDFEKVEPRVNNSLSKKRWFQKPLGLAVLIFFLAVLSISFFLPDWVKSDVTDIVLMIIRALIIVTLWFYLVSPIIRKFISWVILKHKKTELEEIDNILQSFPFFKQIAILSWKDSKKYKGAKKMEVFIFNIIFYFLSLK